jgi:hypothetical protein
LKKPSAKPPQSPVGLLICTIGNLSCIGLKNFQLNHLAPGFKRGSEFAKRASSYFQMRFSKQMNLQKDAKQAKDAKKEGSHFQTSR